LVALARGGDERAFETLVRRHRRPLIRYCRRIGLSDARAEDVLQQALLQAWLALERGSDVRAPKAWLYRTVHNTAVNVLRSPRDDDGALDDRAQVDTSPSAESAFERRIAVRETLRDVAALPQMQRDAILLTAIDGRSHAEIASALGVTHGAVRGLLYRARTTLRDAAAAVMPQPALLWASVLLGRMAPTASRLADLSAPGGNADFGGVLAKGAALAATAAALAVGTGIVPLSRHLAHRSKAVVLALGIAPSTADASESSATPGLVAAPQERAPQAGPLASKELAGSPPSRSRTSAPPRKRAERGADTLERRGVHLPQGPPSASERGSRDGGAVLEGEDGKSGASGGSSRSGNAPDAVKGAESGTADRPAGAHAGSECDHCSERSSSSAADETASHPTDAEQRQAVASGAPIAGAGEAASVEPHGRD
jgi:RNA polymerase sigma factor (sigma-70 family)